MTTLIDDSLLGSLVGNFFDCIPKDFPLEISCASFSDCVVLHLSGGSRTKLDFRIYFADRMGRRYRVVVSGSNYLASSLLGSGPVNHTFLIDLETKRIAAL